MASPRPTRYAPRSQAISPSRGSDPGTARKPRHRRKPAPGEPVAAAARRRGSPDPRRLAPPPTARSRPRLRPQIAPKKRGAAPVLVGEVAAPQMGKGDHPTVSALGLLSLAGLPRHQPEPQSKIFSVESWIRL